MNFFRTRSDYASVELGLISEREAFASILLACTTLEEKRGVEENRILTLTLLRQRLFETVDIPNLIEQAVENYNKVGSGAALIDACIPALTEEVRLPLFVTCMDIILSNRQVSQNEEDVLGFLQNSFNIDEGFFIQCLTVLEIKNRV